MAAVVAFGLTGVSCFAGSGDKGAEIGRPSTLYARAEGGEGLIDRVEVGGQAVTVARGEFRL